MCRLAFIWFWSDLAAADSVWADFVSVGLLSFDLERFGYSGIFFNLGQTISLQWILLSFDLERFGYSEFSFSTISFGDDFSTVDLLPFNLERFGCSEWIQLGTDDFAYSGFDFNLIGSWFGYSGIWDYFAAVDWLLIWYFATVQRIFQFGTISPQWICFHSIWSDLAAVDSVGNDFVSLNLLSIDFGAIWSQWNLGRFRHSGFAYIRFGAIWLQRILQFGTISFLLFIWFGAIKATVGFFNLGQTILLRWICFHSIWSDLATANFSLGRFCCSFERWGREWFWFGVWERGAKQNESDLRVGGESTRIGTLHSTRAKMFLRHLGSEPLTLRGQFWCRSTRLVDCIQNWPLRTVRSSEPKCLKNIFWREWIWKVAAGVRCNFKGDISL